MKKTKSSVVSSFTAPKEAFEELEQDGADHDPLQKARVGLIVDRESDYQKQRFNLADDSEPRKRPSDKWDVKQKDEKKVQLKTFPIDADLLERNRPWTDEQINALFVFDGFKVLPPPKGYVPVTTELRHISSTNENFTESEADGGYIHPAMEHGGEELPNFKSSELQYFEKLVNLVDESTLSKQEKVERAVMKLLLKVKNGTAQMRKYAFRQINERAVEFGADAWFKQILPLLMSPTLMDQERHLLVKVVDRVLYKLDHLVRPYCHKILVVIEPMLIDADYYARCEAKEIIGNLSKAAGLATMISVMRPDIDHVDEYVRNTTARAFAVVACTLGIPSILPFLRAVCRSKKSWQARHTGIKIIQQIAISSGCSILPYLNTIIEMFGVAGLEDEQIKVKTQTALTIASLAEATRPFGIECFDVILKLLWKGVRNYRGKVLAAYLKSMHSLILLMDDEYVVHYIEQIVHVIVREFNSPDEEIKKINLMLLKIYISQIEMSNKKSKKGKENVFSVEYFKENMASDFFRNFLNIRVAMNKKMYGLLIELFECLSEKMLFQTLFSMSNMVTRLKDENEQLRHLIVTVLYSIYTNNNNNNGDSKVLNSVTENALIDGLMYVFQNISNLDDTVYFHKKTKRNAIDMIAGILSNCINLSKLNVYLPQITSIILWRMNNKSVNVRRNSPEIINKLAPFIYEAGEEKTLNQFSTVLFENLNEEYPEVLASIIAAIKSILIVMGTNKMVPPVKELLPRLTPILKNRYELVQEHTIELVGRIADSSAEHVSAREWMRICFELVDLLKAQKKSIRRAAVNTFGFIAKAVGPQDVMATLLSNLKVQERQNRICTTIAVAIVAEACGPFTVLPALMNEYRVPELNVQNGVLKALCFMFEYIGEMGKDYVNAVIPLLEDALTDRDAVHRQIACAGLKHIAVDAYTFSHEEVLTHAINFVFPNVLEHSPHMMNAVLDAMEGFRLAVGAGRLMQYCLQGLFHPARRVRDIYWKIYNIAYIGNCDGLVAFYPGFEGDGRNSGEGYYRRELMYYFL